jgi:hypothetical protein
LMIGSICTWLRVQGSGHPGGGVRQEWSLRLELWSKCSLYPECRSSPCNRDLFSTPGLCCSESGPNGSCTVSFSSHDVIVLTLKCALWGHPGKSAVWRIYTTVFVFWLWVMGSLFCYLVGWFLCSMVFEFGPTLGRQHTTTWTTPPSPEPLCFKCHHYSLYCSSLVPEKETSLCLDRLENISIASLTLLQELELLEQNQPIIGG